MKTNMNKILIFLIVILFGILIHLESNRDVSFREHKYDTCIEIMQKAISDPNDDSRSSFLENCQK